MRVLQRYVRSVLCTAFVLALSAGSLFAQTFPVRVTTSFTAPYTPYLSEWTAPGSDKVAVQLLLNDLTITDYRCKLRLTLEGTNITIATRPDYQAPPLVLQGGVPELLYGFDLVDYFRYNNLQFRGITPQALEANGGKLPEGIYRLTIEVLDYNRSTVVSNRGTATAWIILNAPPLINLPFNHARLTPTDPQNVVFQWTPRHRGSPNAAFSTEYEVKLVEIWPAGRNPYDAMLSARPVLEAVTDQTQWVYGPAETPLIPGREYALQVRARDIEGRDLFWNNGYSEVVKFTYGQACPMPAQIVADDIGTARARLHWIGNGLNTGYRLRYREQAADAAWFEEEMTNTYLIASGMKPGTTYEYELCGVCNFYESPFSQRQTFSTLQENPDAFVCSDPTLVPPPDGSGPLPALFINDFIKAGGFDVVVTKATGGNGQFTGEGLAVVPWFNQAKVRVTFTNISVNKSYQLTRGDIRSVWDPNSRFMIESEKTLAEGGGQGIESVISRFEADSLIQVTGVILSVALNTDGDIVVQTNEGEVVVAREEGKTFALTDEGGNGYLVDEQGKITKTTATEALAADARGDRTYNSDPSRAVRFVKTNETQFGWDEYRPKVLSQHYQRVDNEGYIAWKALVVGQPETIGIETTADLNRLKFKREGLAPADVSASPQSLTLNGLTAGWEEEVLAYYAHSDTTQQPTVVGKLNTVTYEAITRRLTVVKVNSTPLPVDRAVIEQQLNTIYAQAAVKWSVVEDSISVQGIDAKNLDDGASGLLSSYTVEMRTVIEAYLQGRAPAEDTYYAFVLERAKNKDKMGFMPRKRQAAFLFTGAIPEGRFVPTLAHELGHGAFRLEHTFEEYPTLGEGTTDNLMDYGTGTRLNKYQWDYVHDPVAVLGLFEGDEEGALYECPMWFSGECEDVGRILDKIKDLSSRGSDIVTRKPNNPDRKELIAESIELDGTAFKKIRILNLVDTTEIIYDPRDFEEYNQTSLTAEGKLDHQRGFIYRSSPTRTNGGLPTNVKPIIVKILLYDDEDEFGEKLQALKKYLFGDIPTAIMAEILEQFESEVLTPAEIKAVRELIAKVEDEEKRKEFYLELQEKVPYHSQRDNESIATDEDVENNSDWLSAGETAGDIMCNLTSQAMCLEYLGISCPDPDMQFEDYLEELRRDEEFEHRGDPKARKDLSTELGVGFKSIDLNTDDKEILKSKLQPELEKGRAVLLSAFSSPKGHIVRLQAITDEGLIIDDPYGQVQNFSQRENGGFGYTDGKNSTDNSNIKGKDNLWTWANIKDTVIKYAEVYYID